MLPFLVLTPLRKHTSALFAPSRRISLIDNPLVKIFPLGTKRSHRPRVTPRTKNFQARTKRARVSSLGKIYFHYFGLEKFVRSKGIPAQNSAGEC
jgi:hypothetical protein